jgi:phospholipase A1
MKGIWLIPAFWIPVAHALTFGDCLNLEKGNAPLVAQRDCYKRLAMPAEQATVEPPEKQRVKAAPIRRTAKAPNENPAEDLLLSQWDPVENGILSAYRQNYLLPISHSSNMNNAPTSPNPNNQVPYSYPLDNTEAKFQFSFKSRLWRDDNRDWAAWFGYTQLSFWQFWDPSHSRPFRESNYEPELIVSKRFTKDASGLAPRLLNVAIDHQSNGQSNPRSRSWNRIYVQAGFENDDFDGGKLIVLPRIWARVFQESDPAQNDNPDITHYLGYGDIQMIYLKGYELSAIARMRSLQLDYSYPFDRILNYFSSDWHSDFDFHLQYFTGYGESLIDYNYRQNTWGVGVSLPLK